MARVYDKRKSKLLLGIEKVMDRQSAKDKKHSIDIGMNTVITYKNKSTVDCAGLWASRSALIWQPLRYVIKPIPHTYYTYGVSKLTMGNYAINKLRRKKQNSLTAYP